MRTTKAHIDRLLHNLATVSGDYLSAKQAKENGKQTFLFAEYAACYGGYRLVRVDVDKFNHSEAFGLSTVAPRLSASTFAAALSFLIAGLTTKQ